jgi:hypothetical protein
VGRREMLSCLQCTLEEDDRVSKMGTLKRYSKVLEYEYTVKIVALGTLKRYSIISLTLYLEWYSAYSIVGSGGPHWLNKGKKCYNSQTKNPN